MSNRHALTTFLSEVFVRTYLPVLLLSVLFLSGNVFASVPVNSAYVYTQKGEELIDGSTVSITWHITFLSATRAKVDISSWHAPFTCEGEYNVVDKGDSIELLWDKQKNPNVMCVTAEPQFLLQQKNHTLRVKSGLFYPDKEAWFVMKKIQ